MKKHLWTGLAALLIVVVAVACASPTAAPAPTNAPAPTIPLAPTNPPAPTSAPQPTNAPQPTSAPQPTTAANATSAPQPTAAAASGPKVLRIGETTYPDVLDPQKSSFAIEIQPLKLAYEGLLSIDNKGIVGPGSADKWELAPDGMSMTFHIRDGLKRSDGTPITAHDFEYALKREVDPNVIGRSYASILFDVKGARELNAFDPTTGKQEDLDKLWANYGVKATDDSTLVVTFNQPTGFWEYIASTWVTYPTDKRSVDKDADAWWTKAENHVGNGPFIIKSLDEGKQITFVPNPNYWRGKPKLDRIEISYNTDEAVLLEAYKKGELDINGGLQPEQLPAVDADATLKADLLRYPAARTNAIAFNNTMHPFDDRNVRYAFSQAFDRAAYVHDVLQGVGTPYTRWIPPGVPGAQPDKPGVPDSDAAGAVKTLVDNGYAAADSTADNPKVDCDKLGELKLTYPATPINHARAQFLAGNFVKVFSCPITLDPVDPTVFTALTKNVNTNPQISQQRWIEDYPHPQNWLSVYWACGSFSRNYGYCNLHLDDLLKAADSDRDFQDSLKKYQEAEDLLLTDVPAAFANVGENTFLVKPYVIGPKDNTGSSDFTYAGEWGPVWTYDVDLSKVPDSYPKQ